MSLVVIPAPAHDLGKFLERDGAVVIAVDGLEQVADRFRLAAALEVRIVIVRERVDAELGDLAGVRAEVERREAERGGANPASQPERG